MIMTPAPLVLAAALAAWGPVAPAPEPEPPAASAAPAVPAPEAPTAIQPLPPSSAAPARVGTAAPTQPRRVAKAPTTTRPMPALAATPQRTHQPRPPLYKQWVFWVISGGFFVSAVVVAVVTTRPGPQPYTGNVSPYIITSP